MGPDLSAHMSDAKTATDVIASEVANGTTKVGAVTGGIGWLTSNTLIALLGLLIAILGFLVNLYFQHRRDAREREIHALKIKMFLKSTNPSITELVVEQVDKLDGA